MNKRKSLGVRITNALLVAFDYGMDDGAHHKQWVIDQMVRELLGTEANYRQWKAGYEQGGDYYWDEGTPP
jgi:hypothetical protein